MDKKYSNSDAREIVANEGLGYAVQNYCSGKDFKDPELARLWDEAEAALTELECYLNDT